MKTLFSFIFCISFYSLSAQGGSPIQANTPTAISKYYFVSENQIHLSLGIEDKTNNAIMLQKDDANAKAFLNQSLQLVLDSIAKNSSLKLLPIESLKGQVTYSRMGFPLSGLKKAAKKTNHQQYVTIDIAVLASKTISSSISEENSSNSSIRRGSANAEVSLEFDSTQIALKEGTTLNTTEFYPQVQITLKFGNSEGKTISKIKGLYTHPERIVIETETRDHSIVGKEASIGISSIESEYADRIPYFDFLALAVQDLIRQLQ